MAKKKVPATCPCGSSLSYEACCGRFHAGYPEVAPETALELMKSRYAAFVKQRPDYLVATWHKDTCPQDLALDDSVKWLGLQIVNVNPEGEAALSAQEAFVSFVARGKIQGRAFKQAEKSRFVKVNGLWVYVDGVVDEETC